MNFEQSVLISSLLLVIIWWTTNIINKIASSFFLLAVFVIFGSTPTEIVFSFPLSQSFLLIVITYLFSQGIANSGLVDILLEPILIKYANTPFKVILFNTLMFVVTIFIIPQPLARLILIAMLMKNFINKTTALEETKNVLMFSCFLVFTMVNMSVKGADIILNTASLGFAHINMTEIEWISYMSVPVIIMSIIVFSVFIFIFRKDLFNVNLSIVDDVFQESSNVKVMNLSVQQKSTLVIVVITLILWMTESMHGLDSTLVTFLSTMLLFFTKVLNKNDFKAIDITTLVFLTAAFSIGGVMKYSGVADIVFAKIGVIFPNAYSKFYVFLMIISSMLLHMILGSNTTTLSVVIPGLLVVCEGVLPTRIIMFIAYISVASHSILPFHSLPMMIGASNGYFPSKYVTKMGIVVTFIIYISIIFIFVPWWNFKGLI
jgi:di/tricarboxylate transporter